MPRGVLGGRPSAARTFMRTFMRMFMRTCTLAVALAATSACTRGPTPIRYGQENCDFCRMTINDPRFGTELVTARGKVYTFDSIECLASYYLTQDSATRTSASVWVTDFQHPGSFTLATSARYVFGAARVRSPMGRGLLAFAPQANVTDAARTFQGTPMSWTQVLATIQREAASPIDGEDGGHRDASTP